MSKCISPQKKSYTLPILEVQDTQGRTCEVGDGSLEQLITRKRIDDVHERLATMAAALDMSTLENLLHLVTEQGDMARTFAVSDGREQADEAVFTNSLAFGVVFLYANVVEIGIAMHG